MITDVENFFARMMAKANIDAKRDYSDATLEHKFLIKQVNLLNMMVDRVIDARQKSGLPPVGSMKINNIIKTKVWNRTYSESNVRRVFKTQFSGIGKSIFVNKKTGGDVEIVYYSGRYAEQRVIKSGKRKGQLQSKTVQAMKQLWFSAISEIKKELGEAFKSPGHPGARLHGTVGGKGYQATIANQVLAEGGGEGVGYDDAVANFKKDFLEDWPEDKWLVDQAVTQIFNPIKKKYKVKDVQDFTSATATRNISVIVEYGDQAHNNLSLIHISEPTRPY